MTEGAEDRAGGASSGGPTRRQLIGKSLALGGALALVPFPAGPASAAPDHGRPTLRPGSPERAGPDLRPSAPTRHRRGEVPRPLPQVPLVRGCRASRRTRRHGRPASADRQGGALLRVRREDGHRRGVPRRAADPDGRGHGLRPRLGLEAVHLDPGRAADRAGRSGAGGDGRLVPAGVRGRGQAGHHDPSAPHAHLRVPRLDPALQRADVRGEAPAHLERGADRPRRAPCTSTRTST